MHTPEQILQVYLDLADMYEHQQDSGMREVFLMLAADAALRAERPGQAEQLRQNLLRQDPHHVLKPYASFGEAAQNPDIENYLDDLRQKYPVEVAQDLLESIWPQSSQPLPDIAATLPPRQRDQVPLTPPPAPRKPASLKPPANDPEEPLKVYRGSPEVEETQPPPPVVPPTTLHPPLRPNPPRPPVQPRPAPRQPPPPRPAANPPLGTRPRPVPERSARSEAPTAARPRIERPVPPNEPEEQLTNGAWVGTLLFMIVLAVGVALAMWTLLPYELLQEMVQGS